MATVFQAKAAIDSVASSVKAIPDKLRGPEPVKSSDLAMEPPDQRSKRLQECVSGTYWNLRLGMFLMAVALPIVVFLIGSAQQIRLQNSISAYYWAQNAAKETPVRVWFFGFLFAIGMFLYLYRGFSRLEDWLLNAAALFSFGIAIFPMADPNCISDCAGSPVHYYCGIGMFACLALVAWRCNEDTLNDLDADTQKKYKRIYIVFAIALLASPLAAWLLNVFGNLPYIFIAETFGILSFALYWMVKSFEMRKSNDAQRGAKASAPQVRSA